jgi:hypothetical protein
MIILKKSREVLKMARDLKKETEWRKNKYKRLVVDVDKEIAEIFLNKLQKDQKNYSEWVKEKIENYLKK